MRAVETDVAVIGAGSAGLNARREAELQGARTILIESGPYGTTCARVGCMPSKLLISAAEAAHDMSRSEQFGVHAEKIRVDGKAVLERVRKERDRFVGFVVEDTEALPEANRLRGHASFLDPTTLSVSGLGGNGAAGEEVRVEARSIVIATGSSPIIPESLAAVRDRVLTNDSVFELDDLPESVAVIGTGVIGLELAQALHRLGSRVVLFGRSGRLGPLTDPAVQEAAQNSIGRELEIRRARSFSAAPGADGVGFSWTDPEGASHTEGFAFVLAAAGRAPNLSGLDLGRAGLEVDPAGIPIFDTSTGQVGDRAIFIAGDVTGERAILHEASDEGRIGGYNAARFPDIRGHSRKTPLNIIFCDPQIALVGSPFAKLDENRIEIGAVDYGEQGRARVMGKNQGLVRVYGDKLSGRLLGAEMVGPRVEHTAHLLAWVVQQGLTAEQTLQLPFYHPVIEEGIRTALRDLGRKLGVERPPSCARELDCGPGN